MTYEEAKAEFFRISKITLPKWQENILDQIYKLQKENPKKIIEIQRGGRGIDFYYMLLAQIIENFRMNEVKEMKYAEAHNILEELLRSMTRYRALYSDNMIKAVGKAILAIEYRMPKKPKKPACYFGIKYSHIDGYTCICPSCGDKVHFGERCQKCGQELDWTDEDDKIGMNSRYINFDEWDPKK